MRIGFLTLLYLPLVGERSCEEVDLVQRGLNYGWNIVEGNQCLHPPTGIAVGGRVPPLWEYSHSEGCAIVGGYVHRRRDIPSLYGAYLYGDYCAGKIWGLRYDGDSGTEQMLLTDTDFFIASFPASGASTTWRRRITQLVGPSTNDRSIHRNRP